MQFIATTKYCLHNLYHIIIKCSYIHCIYIPALTRANVDSPLQSLTQEFLQNFLVASIIASSPLAAAICVFEK